MNGTMNRTMNRTGFSAPVAAVVMLGVVVAAFGAVKAPPTSAPASPRIVKVADAIPLNDLLTETREANLTDKLTRPQTTQPTYFGELDTYTDPDDDKPAAAVPIIATHNGGEWFAIPLGGDGLKNAGWRYVGAGPAPREIWGALDTAAGETRARFVLAHSLDGGETFELTAFQKPCKLATVFDFAMIRDGHGRVTLSLDSDCGGFKSGLYHYETTDDGKTWSTEPRYEPDAMIRADPVPDEEQPDPPGEGGKRTLSRPLGGSTLPIPILHQGSTR